MFQRTLRKKIGELLIERNIITADQLKIALEEQLQKGGYISQHLIALKFAKESDIAACLSNQYNFAYLPLRHYSIPPEVVRLIPFKWVRLYTLIAVDKLGDSLSVAMADPLNEGVIAMLEEITGLRLKVFISTYSEILEAINYYFKDDILKAREFSLADVNKLSVMGDFIRTKSYSGSERRKYIRVYTKLPMEYTFRGQSCSTTTINISFGGLCFSAPGPMAVDTDLICKVHMEQGYSIDSIIKVLRVQNSGSDVTDGSPYEVAGAFEFMGDDDKLNLAQFLKYSLSAVRLERGL